MGLMEKIFGDLNAKEIKKLEKIAAQVEAREAEYAAMDNGTLRGKTAEFKERLNQGETLDDILPEAFAACREAADRVLGMRHFHVQIIGGIALHQGRIAEMKTGEGKTLVATLPVYLNALAGKGVHVVTVNDYLAKRDAEWMGRVYEFMGLTVGYVIHGVEGEDRKNAYRSDITYGTNNEFGFDYLRDNMVTYQEQLVQRDLNYAIIDEVDSILIDEARTPLIISGRGDKSTDLYEKANDFVSGLKGIRVKDKNEAQGGKSKIDQILDGVDDSFEQENDFIVEEKDKQVSLTERGTKKAEKYFGVENYGDPDNMQINHHVNQALKAHNIMERDVDYIVKDGEIIIVDEFTGRLMFGRRFSNGLHQAIEAKEHVKVKSESKTLATITLQNYFRMYQKLAGMTGTAKTEEDEFRDIYNMDVVVIPTNKEIKREDLPDSVYTTETGKFKAIVNKIAEVHETGQPVLVGTISIEKSERLSDMLDKKGIKHNVLNAKQHEREAEIVAEAGREGHVTIATNMAGRGTDILLGGNPEFETRQEMRKLGFSEEAINFALNKFLESDDPELKEARSKYQEIFTRNNERFASEHESVKERGGLFIIGSERHESRRIDNQLRGRSGRQGDPGASQFFISLEDELMRLFGGDRMEKMQNLVGKLGMEEEYAMEANMLSKSIENAQKRVEGRNFATRKYVLQYDNVMNKQREIIYGERRKVLFGEDLREYIIHMRDTIIGTLVESATADSKFAEEWDFDGLRRNIRQLVPAYEGKRKYDDSDIKRLSPEDVKKDILKELDEIYESKEEEIGVEAMREIERTVLLRVVDSLWMEHIDAMDQLKSGIGLRSIGQQDPAAEYAKEGFDMFEQLIGAIQEDTVKYCYGATLQTETDRGEASVGTASKQEFGGMAEAAATDGAPGAVQVPPRQNKPEPVRREQRKIGRNEDCPCGSGKKYKNCHGRPGAEPLEPKVTVDFDAE